MSLSFNIMPTADARNLQNGGLDAYGNVAESFVSDGNELECRHCGQFIDRGETALLAAWSPFQHRHAFAETGPVLLHSNPCTSFGAAHQPPPAVVGIESTPTRLLRGYDKDERIVYGTGTHVYLSEIASACSAMLENADVESVHIRSSTNNCWQARAQRGSAD